MMDDSNEAIQALRRKLRAAEVSLQEDDLDEKELDKRQLVKSMLDGQHWLKTHKAEKVAKYRQALGMELDRLRIAYFQEDYSDFCQQSGCATGWHTPP